MNSDDNRFDPMSQAEAIKCLRAAILIYRPCAIDEEEVCESNSCVAMLAALRLTEGMVEDDEETKQQLLRR